MKRHLTDSKTSRFQDHKKHHAEDATNTYTYSFGPHPHSKYNRQFPFFREPKEIGYFSQDKTRHFRNDRSQLKFYIPPSDISHCNFDLQAGYDNFIKRDENIKEYLNDLLRWIQLHREVFALPNNSAQKSLNTDFVCWRGLLTKILCTPYENREGWKIAVTFHNGTYYMCEFDTESRQRQRREQTEYQNVLTYGGYKFEQFVTSPEPDGKPHCDSPVDNHEAFCSVVRSRLGKHSLVFGGEVDCRFIACPKYIELKTSRDIETARQDENFKRFKLIKWWAQSFLVGISEIVCGFRGDDSIVRRLEVFKTSDIPKMVKDIRNPWDPTICFNFLDDFLLHIKSVVTKDNAQEVCLFEWNPKGDVKHTILPRDNEYQFLPDWYHSAT